ncbi:rhodanese-like domain-containing protein [Salinifilum ghardaiensis]
MSRLLPEALDQGAARALLTSAPNARVIDVRTPGEFRAEHIPGARNVPLDLLRAHRGHLGGAHEDPLLLVCSSGARAEEARRLLAETDLGDPVVLDGGMAAWRQQGGPVERDAQKWAMERQVRLAAGGLVLTGVLGSAVAPKAKWLAAAVGGGLVFSAVTNTCGMARLLALLPYNRDPAAEGLERLSAITTPRSTAN